MHLRRPGRPRRLRERRLRRHVPHVLPGLRAEGVSLHVRDAGASCPPSRDAHIDERRGSSGSRRRPTRCSTSSTSRRSPPRRRRRARCSSSTTRSRRRTCRQPLALGADIVLHSTTKYLGGHSDVVGGFAGTNDPTIAERLRFLQKSLGAVPGPFDSWLVLRGLKTLAVRMERHCANARAVVGFLAQHPRVDERALARAPGASGPRDRRPADARLRRDGLVPRRDGGRGRRRSSRARRCGRSPRASAASRA